MAEALKRWYLRSPLDIERERQATQQQRYDTFFQGGEARPAPQWQELATTPTASAGVDPRICLSCHWGGVPPLPSQGPFSFEGQPQPPSKPPERDRKQCEMQHDNDMEMCSHLKDRRSIQTCRSRAMIRYSHCRRTGEVGSPIDLSPGAPTR